MIQRFQRYIVEGPWEERFDEAFRWLDKWVIRPVMIFAVLYFGYGCISAFVR